MWRILLLALLVPAGLAAHTPQGPCGSDGQPALGTMELRDGGGGSWYVDDRNFERGNGIWFYEETNGVYSGPGDVEHNLQRGGSSPFVPDDSDGCTDDPNVEPDLLVF